MDGQNVKVAFSSCLPEAGRLTGAIVIGLAMGAWLNGGLNASAMVLGGVGVIGLILMLGGCLLAKKVAAPAVVTELAVEQEPEPELTQLLEGEADTEQELEAAIEQIKDKEEEVEHLYLENQKALQANLELLGQVEELNQQLSDTQLSLEQSRKEIEQMPPIMKKKEEKVDERDEELVNLKEELAAQKEKLVCVQKQLNDIEQFSELGRQLISSFDPSVKPESLLNGGIELTMQQMVEAMQDGQRFQEGYHAMTAKGFAGTKKRADCRDAGGEGSVNAPDMDFDNKITKFRHSIWDFDTEFYCYCVTASVTLHAN